MAKKSEGVASASGFSKALQDILNEYGQSAKIALNEAIEEEAKEVKNQIKKNAKAKGWGNSYVNGFTTTKSSTRLGLTVIIHNKDEYRLVHLLEFGHRIAHAYGSGKETESPALPHIAPAIEHLETDLIRKIEEKLE